MHELVLKYLRSLYWADSHSDTVKEHGNDTKVYAQDLLDDIVDMFDVSFVFGTACIEIWIYEEAPTFDKPKFWDDKKGWWEGLSGDDYILPIAQRVAARTLGHDLVSVQPMNGPSGLFEYIDHRPQTTTSRSP